MAKPHSVVVVPGSNQAAATAVELVEQAHVALIELDGGLGVTGPPRSSRRSGGSVGVVMFGAESLTNAAAFIARCDA